MKRIFIRKLNRTQLFKEATKEIYITSKMLLDFFDCDSIDELATKRSDDKAQRPFFLKSQYYSSKNPQIYNLRLTKENSEVRLTGFSELLPDDVKETDELILEFFYDNNGNPIYLFDVAKKRNVIVMKKISADDDESNFEKMYSNKGIIQFELKKDSKLKVNNSYWLWDSDYVPGIIDNILNIPQTVYVSIKGVVSKKKIRFVYTGQTFDKLLRAASNSNNQVVTCCKELFVAESFEVDKWVPYDISLGLFEIVCENDYVIITDRKATSITFYRGELSE